MTYCLVIDRDLEGECPLEQGKCFYQHRQTGQCVAYKLTDTESVNTLATAVGLSVPEPKVVRDLQRQIQQQVTLNLRGKE